MLMRRSPLMVIGYGFVMAHINERSWTAVAGGLELYWLDPLGTEVLDKRDPRAMILDHPLRTVLLKYPFLAL